MVKKYFHPVLGREITAPAGYYIPLEENLLPYEGKRVIYVLGSIYLDSSCCGNGNWTYIQVPGYLANEHLYEDELNSPVSEIETIQDEVDRSNIIRLLQDKYPDARIEMSQS